MPTAATRTRFLPLAVPCRRLASCQTTTRWIKSTRTGLRAKTDSRRSTVAPGAVAPASGTSACFTYCGLSSYVAADTWRFTASGEPEQKDKKEKSAFPRRLASHGQTSRRRAHGRPRHSATGERENKRTHAPSNNIRSRADASEAAVTLYGRHTRVPLRLADTLHIAHGTPLQSNGLILGPQADACGAGAHRR